MNQHIKNAVLCAIASRYSSTLVIDFKVDCDQIITDSTKVTVVDVVFYSYEHQQCFCVMVDIPKKQIVQYLCIDEEDVVSSYGDPWNNSIGEVECN